MSGPCNFWKEKNGFAFLPFWLLPHVYSLITKLCQSIYELVLYYVLDLHFNHNKKRNGRKKVCNLPLEINLNKAISHIANVLLCWSLYKSDLSNCILFFNVNHIVILRLSVEKQTKLSNSVNAIFCACGCVCL